MSGGFQESVGKNLRRYYVQRVETNYSVRFKEDISKKRVWKFYPPVIQVDDESSYDGYNNTDKSGNREPNMEEQFRTIEGELMCDWNSVSGADTSNKKNVRIFEECFSPAMILPEVHENSTLLKIYRNFHCLSVFNKEEVDEMENDCEKIRNQMIENKKDVMKKIEALLDSQISKFDTDVLEKCRKRKKLLQSVDTNILDQKVSRGDVILSSSEKLSPLTNIIMKCSDALTIIFKYIPPRDLIMNFTPSCSMFLRMIQKIPLTIEIDERDMFLYRMEKMISKYHIRDLRFLPHRNESRNQFNPSSKHVTSGPIFPTNQKVESLSSLFTTHTHQIRNLSIETSISVGTYDTWNQNQDDNNKNDDDGEEEDKDIFYNRIINIQCLEFFITNQKLPSDMTSLSKLKVLEFSPSSELSDSDVKSLKSFFSTKRPLLTKLVFLCNVFLRHQREFEKNRLGIKNHLEVLSCIPSSCVNLNTIKTNLFFGFESYPDHFIDFIVGIQNVELQYDGKISVDGEQYRPDIGWQPEVDVLERAKKDVTEKITKEYQKEYERLCHKIEYFQNAMRRIRASSDHKSISITTTPDLTGEISISIFSIYVPIYEFRFMMDLMKTTKTSIDLELSYSDPLPSFFNFLESSKHDEFLCTEFKIYELCYEPKLDGNQNRNNNWWGGGGGWVGGGLQLNEGELKELSKNTEIEAEKYCDAINSMLLRFINIKILEMEMYIGSKSNVKRFNLDDYRWFLFTDLLKCISKNGMMSPLKSLKVSLSHFVDDVATGHPLLIPILQTFFSSLSKFLFELRSSKDEIRLQKIEIILLSKYKERNSNQQYGYGYNQNPINLETLDEEGRRDELERREREDMRLADCMKIGAKEVLKALEKNDEMKNIKDFRLNICLDGVKSWDVQIICLDGVMKKSLIQVNVIV